MVMKKGSMAAEVVFGKIDPPQETTGISWEARLHGEQIATWIPYTDRRRTPGTVFGHPLDWVDLVTHWRRVVRMEVERRHRDVYPLDTELDLGEDWIEVPQKSADGEVRFIKVVHVLKYFGSSWTEDRVFTHEAYRCLANNSEENRIVLTVQHKHVCPYYTVFAPKGERL